MDKLSDTLPDTYAIAMGFIAIENVGDLHQGIAVLRKASGLSLLLYLPREHLCPHGPRFIFSFVFQPIDFGIFSGHGGLVLPLEPFGLGQSQPFHFTPEKSFAVFRDLLVRGTVPFFVRDNAIESSEWIGFQMVDDRECLLGLPCGLLVLLIGGFGPLRILYQLFDRDLANLVVDLYSDSPGKILFRVQRFSFFVESLFSSLLFFFCLSILSFSLFLILSFFFLLFLFFCLVVITYFLLFFGGLLFFFLFLGLVLRLFFVFFIREFLEECSQNLVVSSSLGLDFDFFLELFEIFFVRHCSSFRVKLPVFLAVHRVALLQGPRWLPHRAPAKVFAAKVDLPPRRAIRRQKAESRHSP